MKEIRGIVANKGKAKGKVRVIRGQRDFKNFKEGEILVAELTDPSFASIVIKAAAIITDKGGITSHPAIIAREFGIPCLVGAKIATKVLKNGNKVEIDLNKGVIKILK